MIISGRSADGSDAKIFAGFFINPNDPNEWSSFPYPGTDQQSQANLIQEIMDYILKSGKHFGEIHDDIRSKKCPLSVRARKHVLAHYEEDGNFIATNIAENKKGYIRSISL